MKLSAHRDDRENVEIATTAGDMAWGHLKDWYQARGLTPDTTAEKCRELALDICVEDGGREASDTDPAQDICLELLHRLGFRVKSGTVGFDAVLEQRMCTYTVWFRWWMPVEAPYRVELPANATPEQIIEAAHKAGEEDVWERQEDNTDFMTATTVNEIEVEGEDRKIPVPDAWDEDRIVHDHFFGAHNLKTFRIVEHAHTADERMLGAELHCAWDAWRYIRATYSAEEINEKRVAIVEVLPDGGRRYEHCFTTRAA